MAYPTFAEQYEVLSITYRRGLYGKKAASHVRTAQANHLPVGGGDTEDLYNDEEEYDDGPPCGVGQTPDELEETTDPQPNYGPPPGFDFPAVSSSTKNPRPDTMPSAATTHGASDHVITQEGPNKWKACIEVAPNLHGMLIGLKHAKKREMEDATQCRINFPARGSNSSLIQVTSSVSKENVSRCLARIEATVISKEKMGAKAITHFAAFPCNDLAIVKRFEAFTDMIVNGNDVVHGKLADLFTSKMKLHVTICMLQLQTEDEKRRARSTMAQLKEKHKNSFPMEVRVEGLDIMNDDPADAHVLFAKVQGEELQEIADDVKKDLLKAGLVSRNEKDNSVKMHMTLMNSRYAMDDENKWSDRKSFDVTSLLKNHGNFSFGSFLLDRLTICTLHTEDAKTGFYECFVEEKLRAF